MRIFGTFKGVTYIENKNGLRLLQLKWADVCDDAGQYLKGMFTSNKTNFSDSFKVGNRYVIECKEIINNKISTLTSTKLAPKNKTCDIMRKANNTYYFIKGKYKGLTLLDISNNDAHNYMIWLAKNSSNEASIKNALDILSLINEIK